MADSLLTASTGLSPELLAQLHQQFAQGNYSGFTSGDKLYSPIAQTFTGEDAGNPSKLLGFAAYDPSNMKPGANYDYYDPTGASAGTRQIENGSGIDLGMMLALAIIGGGALGAFSGAGAAATEGGTVGASTVDGAGGMSLAEGAYPSSITAGDASLGTGATGAGGAGLNPAFDTVGDITSTNPALGSGVGNGAPLPMTPGGWEAATIPAAGAVPATSMGFDAALGSGAGAAGGGTNLSDVWNGIKTGSNIVSLLNSLSGGSATGGGGSSATYTGGGVNGTSGAMRAGAAPGGAASGGTSGSVEGVAGSLLTAKDKFGYGASSTLLS